MVAVAEEVSTAAADTGDMVVLDIVAEVNSTAVVNTTAVVNIMATRLPSTRLAQVLLPSIPDLGRTPAQNMANISAIFIPARHHIPVLVPVRTLVLGHTPALAPILGPVHTRIGIMATGMTTGITLGTLGQPVGGVRDSLRVPCFRPRGPGAIAAMITLTGRLPLWKTT